MRVFILVLFFCVMGHLNTFADNPPAATGNQGYIYGTPPKTDPATTDTTQADGPDNLVDTVKKIDSWIQNNLW